MKREISRINNQVKRGLHRIEEALSEVERNQTLLKSNADQVVTEIDEINRRLTLALKERTDYLKSSVEKNLDDGTKWDDIELMDCKDIFIKMMDWIRNYDTSNEEYTRRIRFTCHDTVNDLAKRILEIGDLKMQENKGGKDADEFESRSSGLSRSKSDHRLVSEFRRQEESSPPRRRAFGESRYNRDANKSRTNLNRYGGGDDEDEEPTGRSRYRSRFLRGGGDDDDDNDRRNSRHMEEDPIAKKERNKVIDTEDASRGPLSGCIRLADSSRVIQRLKSAGRSYSLPRKMNM